MKGPVHRALLPVCLAALAGARGAPGTDGEPAGGAAATASLAVRGVQGTPGGPPITDAEVTVRLFHQGALVDTIRTQLDGHGVVLVEDLPLAMDLVPAVEVRWRDMTYRQVGAVIDAAHPQQALDVTCWEPTAERPDWHVRMWHVLADHGPDGLRVSEIVVVESPAERTWIGASPGEGRRPVTTSFALPPGARNVTLGDGFHDWCCTTLADGMLVNHLPLMPGATEFKFRYLVPPLDGTVTLAPVAPAAAEHLMVVVPAELEPATIERLTYSSTESVGDRTIRAYMASGLAAGEGARIVLSGLGTTAAARAAAPAAAATPGTTVAARAIAAGGGAILVIAAAVIAMRRRARSGPGTAAGEGSLGASP